MPCQICQKCEFKTDEPASSSAETTYIHPCLSVKSVTQIPGSGGILPNKSGWWFNVNVRSVPNAIQDEKPVQQAQVALQGEKLVLQ